ncbi:MAG: hypothetical protein PHS37_05410 [Candidatus Omnitrophica bacterium]|nr:hypothetical protein [Candidatus Omnitrophota bacterium]
MKLTIREGEANRPFIARISELTQRTNQFNLTLKRYTETDIRDILNSKSLYVFTVELDDKFGNDGIVAVVILREKNAREYVVDTFCMSCRAMGLSVERAIMAVIMKRAYTKLSCGKLTGIYNPGERNACAKDLYASMGFKQEPNDIDKNSVWTAGLSGSMDEDTGPIAVTYSNDGDPSPDIGTIIDHESSALEVLVMDLMQNKGFQERSFVLKYDESRLSRSQVDVIRQYAETVGKRCGVDILIQPFDGSRASKKRGLLEVSCTGSAGTSTASVNIDTGGNDISEYLLCLMNMLNIAFAASTIPDDVTQEQLKTIYGPVLGFINSQYRAIIGADLQFPATTAGLLAMVRSLTLSLPRMYRVACSLIEDYNKRALQALISA